MISSNITQNKSEVVLWEEVVEEAVAVADAEDIGRRTLCDVC